MAIAAHDVHDDHGHDDHGHGGQDDHGGHDDHGAHGPQNDSWVLIPLAVGILIGIVLLVVLGLDSGVAPSVH